MEATLQKAPLIGPFILEKDSGFVGHNFSGKNIINKKNWWPQRFFCLHCGNDQI